MAPVRNTQAVTGSSRLAPGAGVLPGLLGMCGMTRREPCVVVKLRIERPPEVEIISDSPEDFKRLSYSIRANAHQHDIVRAVILMRSRERDLVE